MTDVFRAVKGPIGGDFDDSPVSSNAKIPAYGKEGSRRDKENRLAQDIVTLPPVPQGKAGLDIYLLAKQGTTMPLKQQEQQQQQEQRQQQQQWSSWSSSSSSFGGSGDPRTSIRHAAQQLQSTAQQAQGQLSSVIDQLEYVPPPASLAMTGELLSSAAEVFTTGANNWIWWANFQFLPSLQQKWNDLSAFWGKAAPLAQQEARHLAAEFRPAVRGAINEVQPAVNKTTATAKNALQEGWDGVCNGVCTLRDEVCEGACYLADRAALIEGKAVSAVKGAHLPAVHLPAVHLPSVQLPSAPAAAASDIITGKVKSVLPSGTTSASIKTVSAPVQAEENAYQRLLDRVVDANNTTTNVVTETLSSATSTVKQKAAEVLPVLQPQQQQQQESTMTAAAKKAVVKATGQPKQPSKGQLEEERTTTITKTYVVDPGKTNVVDALHKQKAEQ